MVKAYETLIGKDENGLIWEKNKAMIAQEKRAKVEADKAPVVEPKKYVSFMDKPLTLYRILPWVITAILIYAFLQYALDPNALPYG